MVRRLKVKYHTEELIKEQAVLIANIDLAGVALYDAMVDHLKAKINLHSAQQRKLLELLSQ